MRSVNTLASGAFRYALLVSGVFALFSLILLVIVDRSVADYAREATRGNLTNEASGLANDDHHAGREALMRIIAERRSGRDPQFQYAIVDPAGRPVGRAPFNGALMAGWSVVSVFDPEDVGAGRNGYQQLQSYGVKLADGSLLIVATDTYDVAELRRNLDAATVAGGLSVTLLALIGGYFLGGRFLRRLDKVNAAVERIMAGRLTERLPQIGMSREFDALSTNLNTMLDRINALMDGLRQVSTDIAHDLRTPLTRLRQHLEAVSSSTKIQDYEKAIADGLDQTDDILRVFSALLRIGALEAGAVRRPFGAVDLTELMERVYRAYEPVADDLGRSLKARIEPGISIDGDAELLTQLFTNLVDNALAHTPVGSEIVMTLYRLPDHIRAQIDDNGSGVPDAERLNVLKRFYRLDTSRSTSGAGLGLALVAAIATIHDARLELADCRPGLRVTIDFSCAPIIRLMLPS